MKEEVNEHGTMTITGFIEDEMEENYLHLLTGNVWERVEKVGKDGERQTLFWGIVTDFSINSEYHQKQMTLKISSGSWLLDQEKHFRTYQDNTVTYEDIFRKISGDTRTQM